MGQVSHCRGAAVVLGLVVYGLVDGLVVVGLVWIVVVCVFVVFGLVELAVVCVVWVVCAVCVVVVSVVCALGVVGEGVVESFSKQTRLPGDDHVPAGHCVHNV